MTDASTVQAAVNDTELMWRADTAAAIMRTIDGEDIPLHRVDDKVDVSSKRRKKIVRLLKKYGLVDGGPGRNPDYSVTERGYGWLEKVDA